MRKICMNRRGRILAKRKSWTYRSNSLWDPINRFIYLLSGQMEKLLRGKSGNFSRWIKGAKYRFALQDGTWDFSWYAVAAKGLILRWRGSHVVFSSCGGILELRRGFQASSCVGPGKSNHLFELWGRAGFTSLLSLSIRGQTEWKPQSQETNQNDHVDHSIV